MKNNILNTLSKYEAIREKLYTKMEKYILYIVGYIKDTESVK